MDYFIGGITSIVVLGGVPVAAYNISRIIDRFTK